MLKQNSNRKIRYRKLDFLVDEGYKIGENGSVWSRRKLVPLGGKKGFICVLTNEWKQLKPGKSGRYKHLTIALRKNGKMKSHYVHRLVLEAFVGPCPEEMECRHLDGDPANNWLWNLKWGTSKENKNDMKRHGTSLKGRPGLRGELNGLAKATTEKVIGIRKLFVTGKHTCAELSKKFDLPFTTVYPIICGKTWKHLLDE